MEDKEDQNELNNLQTTVFLELWTEPTVTASQSSRPDIRPVPLVEAHHVV